MSVKISALTAVTLAATGDLFCIVDVSDTSMAASGTDKRITFDNLLTSLAVLPLAGGTMTGRINVPFAADRLTTFIGNASYGLNATNADGAICVVQGGTPHIVFVGTQSRSKSNIVLGWADTTDNSTAADTGLARSAAGVVEVNNGTSGTFRDLKLRSLIMTQGSGSVIILPTADPGVSGALWNNAGTITISP
jgi:hypothetical protein